MRIQIRSSGSEPEQCPPSGVEDFVELAKLIQLLGDLVGVQIERASVL